MGCYGTTLEHGGDRMPVIIAINFELPDDYLEDVLCTAIEGGINHWCDEFTVHNSHDNIARRNRDEYPDFYYWVLSILNDGGYLYLEDDEGECHKLTLDAYKEGIQKFLVEEYNDNRTMDSLLYAGNIDASDADMIIQYSIYGKLVYS